MKENRGTTQEVEDVVSEAISQEVLEDLHWTPQGSEPLSMPICFLVKEQAKSLVALQELQKRVQQIEATQNDVVSTVTDVQEYLSKECSPCSLIFSKTFASPESTHSVSPTIVATQSLHYNPSSAQSSHMKCSPRFVSNLKENVKPSVGTDETSPTAGPMGSLRTKDTAPESDKQDSGLDSDCRELCHESDPSHAELQYSRLVSHANRKDSDELLDLLDEIMKKSEVLKQQVSSVEETSLPNTPETITVQFEQVRLRNLLSNIKRERDGLKDKLVDLATSTNELVTEKQALEQKFMSTLVEKHQLETKIHGLQSASFVDSSPEHRLCADVSKVSCQIDGEAVSSILKETNMLDLQKQVLTYMMENQVMRSKLEQVHQILAAKNHDRDYREKALYDEVQSLSVENKQLTVCFEEQRLDNASLISRVRMLERVIQSMTLENQELIGQLDVVSGRSCVPLSSNINKQRFSSHTLNSRLSKQVISPTHVCEPGVNVNCTKSRLLSNASSFIDVTIEESDISDTCLTVPLKNDPRKFSTPLSFGKKVENRKFPDFVTSSPIASSAKSNACSVGYPKPNKRLTFNSMKTLAAPGNLNFSSGENTRRKVFRSPSMNACDNSFKEAGGLHPLQSIQERNIDPGNLPFYALFEKLKSDSDLPDDVLPSGSRLSNKCSSSDRNENLMCSASAHNCCLNPSDTSHAASALIQVKEKKAVSKNIHKRIQNILDRITAESDASAV